MTKAKVKYGSYGLIIGIIGFVCILISVFAIVIRSLFNKLQASEPDVGQWLAYLRLDEWGSAINIGLVIGGLSLVIALLLWRYPPAAFGVLRCNPLMRGKGLLIARKWPDDGPDGIAGVKIGDEERYPELKKVTPRDGLSLKVKLRLPSGKAVDWDEALAEACSQFERIWDVNSVEVASIKRRDAVLLVIPEDVLASSRAAEL